MRKTDISNYNDESTSGSSLSVGAVVGGFFAAFRKVIVTAFMIFLITTVVIGISIIFYLFSIANEPLNINLNKMKLSLTSFVYVLKEDCDVSDAADTDNYEKYQELYSGENRVWVKYQDIPKYMIDAQVAIEDKRFWEHNGVDWYRTGGAIFSLATGGSQYGGSTITQQLIKNITNDNDVSITRKLREIFRAMKMEDVGIVLMTEKAVKQIQETVYDYKLTCKMPLIVEVPDRHATSKISDTISKYLSEAVGIKL